MQINPHMGISPEECVEKYGYLVTHICRKFNHQVRGKVIDPDDLHSVGNLALMRAYIHFDPTKTDKTPNFAGYASRSISGSIFNFFRDFGTSLRFSRKDKEAYVSISRAGLLDAQVEVIASKLGISEEMATNGLLYGMNRFPVSMDTPLNTEDDGTTTIGDVVVAPYVDPDRKLVIEEFYTRLSSSEKTLMELYVKGYTQAQIAEMLGVSQMTVCRRLNSAFDKAYEYGETTKQGNLKREAKKVRKAKGDLEEAKRLLAETKESCLKIAQKTGVLYATVRNWSHKIRGDVPKGGERYSKVTTRQMTDEERDRYATKGAKKVQPKVEANSVPESQVPLVAPPSTIKGIRDWINESGLSAGEDSGLSQLIFSREGVAATDLLAYFQSVIDTVNTTGMSKVSISLSIHKS